jgi:hypothetical protein
MPHDDHSSAQYRVSGRCPLASRSTPCISCRADGPSPQVGLSAFPISEVAGYLQDQLGQRIAAHLAGLRDAKQIGRYCKPDGPAPNQTTDLRLREGYKIVESFDEKTARAWLFGTNTRLDDEAPIDVLPRAEDPPRFAAVRAAARQLVNFGG